EDVKRAQPAQHVLAQVGPVDAKNQVVAPAAQQLGLELAGALTPRDALHRPRVDRQGISPHPDIAPLAANHAPLEVDVETEQVLAALQEVATVGAGVKADDVV